MSNYEDILNTDLSGVDTSRPVLRPGHGPAKITSIAINDNKAGDGKTMQVNFALEDSCESTKGDVINPGFNLSTWIGLTARDKYPVERIHQELKKLQVACGHEDGPFGDPQQYVGSIVNLRWDVEMDKRDDTETNRVKGYTLIEA